MSWWLAGAGSWRFCRARAVLLWRWSGPGQSGRHSYPTCAPSFLVRSLSACVSINTCSRHCCCLVFCAQVHDDGSTLEADNGEVVPDVDVIVFATGFDLMGPLAQFDIRGPGNKSFNEALSEVPQELYGLATAGFPNLFTLLGYNTGGWFFV